MVLKLWPKPRYTRDSERQKGLCTVSGRAQSEGHPCSKGPNPKEIKTKEKKSEESLHPYFRDHPLLARLYFRILTNFVIFQYLINCTAILLHSVYVVNIDRLSKICFWAIRKPPRLLYRAVTLSMVIFCLCFGVMLLFSVIFQLFLLILHLFTELCNF